MCGVSQRALHSAAEGMYVCAHVLACVCVRCMLCGNARHISNGRGAVVGMEGHPGTSSKTMLCAELVWELSTAQPMVCVCVN